VGIGIGAWLLGVSCLLNLPRSEDAQPNILAALGLFAILELIVFNGAYLDVHIDAVK
jgi:hypothetical protein